MPNYMFQPSAEKKGVFMKKYIIVIFVLILSVSAQNLLQNPGFESWTGGIPDYWEKDDSIAVFCEESIVHNGSFSVKDSFFTQTQTRANFFQGKFVVQANTEYNFTVWIYDNDPAGRIRHGIYWLPDSNSSMSTIYSVDSTGWQEMAFTTISPSNAESAQVVIRAYDVSANWDGGAIFYIDDVCLEASSMQSPMIMRVWHTPTNPDSGNTEDVYAKVIDDGTIIADTLFYGINNLNNPINISHSSVANDTFQYQIPGQTTGDTVFYYLKFVDNDGLSSVTDTHAYYVSALNIFINEVYYDTPGPDSGCFIEVFGPDGVNLDGFSLVGINGNNGAGYAIIDLSGYIIPGDGFFVVAEYATVPNADLVNIDANLQNGPDNLELRFNNITIDALGYGTLNGWFFTGEWLPAPDIGQGHCLGRYPDGYDTDNNYLNFNDYTTQTPGQPNPEVGVNENKISVINLSVIANPVHSGVLFATLISNNNLFPVVVYNAAGQAVANITNPKIKLYLPCGVYFLKLKNIEGKCAKIVVVK